MHLSDNCVGYVNNGNKNLDLFLPEYMVNDDVCLEICCLWVALSTLQCDNCAIEVICHRKSTWLCLKKKRHSSSTLAAVLRLIFWWSMFFNVKLVFTHVPIR